MPSKKKIPASRRKSAPKRPYPLPTKWHRGFVSRRQASYFKTHAQTRKYVDGMTYDIPPVGHGKAASKIARLPYKVGRKTKRK